MKKLITPLLIVVLAMSGCASSGFLGFLATTGYVDNKTKKLEEGQAAEISKLKTQMAELQGLKEQLQASLSTIPKEVLKELSDAINAYLKAK